MISLMSFDLVRIANGRLARTVLFNAFTLACCLTMLAGGAVAEDESAPATASSESQPVESPPAVQPTENEPPKVETHTVGKVTVEKRRRAMAGLAALGGITILGVGTIAATMLWARRLRRLARDAGPAQSTEGNDFWFLKPPKPTVSESDPGESHRPFHSPPPPEPPEAPE